MEYANDITITMFKNNHFELSQQYPDDISYISDSDYIIEKYKNQIPSKLKERNLNVNRDKTEEYTITRN